ncbi:MAG TPA: O-antigen ligase family protein [Thermoanaerobaculia bacterium]|nr:O-antigen ligase family protein [Thermoanaerobaculia bacterium]
MKPARSKPRRPSAVPAKTPLDLRLGTFFLWLLALVPPFLFASMVKESFRQPKLLASEWFALASLACLAWGLSRVETVRLADVWRLPAARIVLPVLAIATAGLATTRHPVHAREGLIDLWTGAAALVGWSAALPSPRLARLLEGLLWPAAVLALIGIGQFHGLWQPMTLVNLDPGSRLAITSLAGNPGDLGAYLVLPVLVAQASLRRRLRAGEGWGRPAVSGTAAALVVCLYALLLTQTLAALAAVAVGSLLLWGALLPRRRSLLALAAGALAMLLLVAAVPPLRQRVVEKARQAASGDLNAVLTGRLDGWRTAVWMLARHPLTGVGHGAYRPEFVTAKLALMDRGVSFYPDLTQVGFGNAHNEYLEVGAEWGIPGLLALAWGFRVLLGALRRSGRPAEEQALAWAGTAALAVLSLVDFPFRVALVAFPALLFLSWVLTREEA